MKKKRDGTKKYIAHSDQLEKLWHSLKAYSVHTPYYLFYLTMDWVMPIQSINESVEAITDDDFSDYVYWLSWQRLPSKKRQILLTLPRG